MYPESLALVTVTVQDPADVNDSVVPTTEHPAVPADVTAYVVAPPPDPPVEVRVRDVGYVALVLVRVRAPCVPRATVTVVAEDEIALYPTSAALVTVTAHVPAEVNDRVVPNTEHPAVPAVVAYVVAPLPAPPVDVSVSDVGYVALVEVRVRTG